MTGDPALVAPTCTFGLTGPVPLTSPHRVVDFYDGASDDYLHWSPGYNMHLGYFRWGLNPLDREGMLEQFNAEVGTRLGLDARNRSLLVDLGCGAGAIARSVAKRYSNSNIKGVTVVPSQVATATRLNHEQNLHERIAIFHGDYTALPFANDTADGVWAVESACHAAGPAKENLIREMARVLKPGGRFVVADCFVKRPDKEFGFLTAFYYRVVCRSWVLPEMPAINAFVAALKKHGFRELKVEDISWRVAPSVLHAPFVVVSFLLKKLWKREPLIRQSRDNLKASLLALPLGINREKISYYLISGTVGDSIR